MAFANGRIPTSVLAPIPGSSPRPGGRPLLRKDAARAYNALHNYSMQRWGISMALSESTVRRAYREYAAQVLAKRLYGSNAATPGTSNHGLGINVDLVTRQQRWVIDQVGHLFGFSKRWSDAAWEWWHITYRAATYPMVAKYAGGSSPLRFGSRGKRVAYLQYLLRRHGYRKLPAKGKPGRGIFGKATRAALIDFQRRKGLGADGVCGSQTWKALRQEPQPQRRARRHR